MKSKRETSYLSGDWVVKAAPITASDDLVIPTQKMAVCDSLRNFPRLEGRKRVGASV